MVVEMACELDNIESSRKHTYMEVMGVERLTQEEADDWKRGGAALWQPCGADSLGSIEVIVQSLLKIGFQLQKKR
jgi:hypothetical protein